MTGPDTKDPIAPFRRPESDQDGVNERDRAEAMRLFFRMDDGSRLVLLGHLMAAWIDDERLNRHMVGTVFRQAWDSEPYIGGLRAGSYFTALATLSPDGPIWALGEVAEQWGPVMMTPDEAARLEAMPFPMTVYRGGTGEPETLAWGVNWTLKGEVAEFYAQKWPARRGDGRPALVLSVEIDRDEVAALFDERDEAELLLPDIGHRYPEMRRLDPAR